MLWVGMDTGVTLCEDDDRSVSRAWRWKAVPMGTQDSKTCDLERSLEEIKNLIELV